MFNAISLQVHIHCQYWMKTRPQEQKWLNTTAFVTLTTEDATSLQSRNVATWQILSSTTQVRFT